MTRDANQIAQEAARRQVSARAVAPDQTKARGALTIQNRLEDGHVMSEWLDVVVQFHPGVLIISNPDGSRDLVYPVPGWYVHFEPNHEGE